MNRKQLTKGLILGLAVAILAIGGGYAGAYIHEGNEEGTATAADQATIPAGPPADDPVSENPAYQARQVAQTDFAVEDADAVQVARAFQQRTRTLAQEILPIVVEVNVVNVVTQRLPGGSPFDFFFGNPNQNNEPREREQRQQGLGSGVIVAQADGKAYVLTNNHVAGNADEIEIVLHDKRSYEAELVGSDELMDLALLSFETDEEVPVARLGDSSGLEVGDWVFAVGNPFGFESTLTAGIVSAKGRNPGARSGMTGVTDYIQTDAAINRGNSGGALVNLDGEVVGINTWIASQSGGSIGLGFAIPVNNAKRAIGDFMTQGKVEYAWLGVQTGGVTQELREAMRLGNREGAFVSSIFTESPAAQSGIRPGDLITAVNNRPITNPTELVQAVANLQPGNRVPFEIVRDGREMTLRVRTASRANEEEIDSAAAKVWPGLSAQPLNDQVRERLTLEASAEGVVVAGVYPGSPAASAGLRVGDVVVGINGRDVEGLSDFYRELNHGDGDEEVRFRIRRDGRVLVLGFLRPEA
ncbi:MAG: Do family serine endopeptidase [Spirochaetaceae bacterium]